MDDLMNKLQSVLSDEESMKQIKELADMLTGEMQQDSSQENRNSAPNNSDSAQNQPQNTNQNGSAPDFSKLLQSLGGFNPQGPNQPQGTQNSMPNIDMAKLMKIQSIMQAANKPDKNVDLLLALRPLLKEENQIKIDRLVKIFKLFAIYPALKESGLLGGDLFGLF